MFGLWFGFELEFGLGLRFGYPEAPPRLCAPELSSVPQPRYPDRAPDRYYRASYEPYCGMRPTPGHC